MQVSIMQPVWRTKSSFLSLCVLFLSLTWGCQHASSELDHDLPTPDKTKTAPARAAEDTEDPENTAPKPVLTSSMGRSTFNLEAPVQIDFGKDVTGFTAKDIVVENGYMSDFLKSPDNAAVYTFTVWPETNFIEGVYDTQISILIEANVAQDLQGHFKQAIGGLSAFEASPCG